MRAVGGLILSTLLLLLTCSSVSAYQMPALITGGIILISIFLLAYLVVVAVRCRHRPDTPPG